MKKIVENFNKTYKEKKAKNSLGTIFILFFTSFLILFITIILMSHYRLNEYKNLLNSMSQSAIPKTVSSSNLFNHVNELIYLTERLNNTNSQALKRITYENINKKVMQIRETKKDISHKNSFLNNKIEVIQKELFELNNLIEKRLIIEEKIEKRIEKLQTLNSSVIATYKNFIHDKTHQHTNYDAWRLQFSEIVNLTYQALTLKRLNQLRLTISQLQNMHHNILKEIEKIDEPLRKTLSPFCSQLEKIVFENDALLQLKIEQLKITGRAIGRGNFVNNLLSDFSNEINFSLVEETNAVVTQAKKNSQKVQEQVNYMFYLFLFVFLYLIAISYFVNKKLISRLIRLNENVKDRIKGKNTILVDEGNDEISYLTHSFNYYSNKLNEQKNQLEELSLTDSLTALANRRFFDMKFANELSLIKRHNYTISILLMDIDFFKLYNDNYGHLAGDKCLQRISKELHKVVKRDLDLVARFGGEEFIALLSNTSIEDSKLMAQKVVDNVANLKIPHTHNRCSKYVTISVGVTTINKDSLLDETTLVEQADKALYKAKERGKNQFVHYEDIKEGFEQSK